MRRLLAVVGLLTIACFLVFLAGRSMLGRRGHEVVVLSVYDIDDRGDWSSANPVTVAVGGRVYPFPIVIRANGNGHDVPKYGWDVFGGVFRAGTKSIPMRIQSDHAAQFVTSRATVRMTTVDETVYFVVEELVRPKGISHDDEIAVSPPTGELPPVSGMVWDKRDEMPMDELNEMLRVAISIQELLSTAGDNTIVTERENTPPL